MKLALPQVLVIVWLSAGLGVNIAKDREVMPNPRYDSASAAFNAAALIVLLWWGGFFS